jgi:hypothetical protein
MYVILIIDSKKQIIISEKYYSSTRDVVAEYRIYSSWFAEESDLLDNTYYVNDRIADNKYIAVFNLHNTNKLKLDDDVNSRIRPSIDLFITKYNRLIHIKNILS